MKKARSKSKSSIELPDRVMLIAMLLCMPAVLISQSRLFIQLLHLGSFLGIWALVIVLVKHRLYLKKSRLAIYSFVAFAVLFALYS